jgi:hypothetical protein
VALTFPQAVRQEILEQLLVRVMGERGGAALPSVFLLVSRARARARARAALPRPMDHGPPCAPWQGALVRNSALEVARFLPKIKDIIDSLPFAGADLCVPAVCRPLQREYDTGPAEGVR